MLSGLLIVFVASGVLPLMLTSVASCFTPGAPSSVVAQEAYQFDGSHKVVPINGVAASSTTSHCAPSRT